MTDDALLYAYRSGAADWVAEAADDLPVFVARRAIAHRLLARIKHELDGDDAREALDVLETFALVLRHSLPRDRGAQRVMAWLDELHTAVEGGSWLAAAAILELGAGTHPTTTHPTERMTP